MVKSFLDKSEQAENERKRQEENAKEEKRIRETQIEALKRQRWLIGGVAAGVTVVFLSLAGWGVYGQYQAKQARNLAEQTKTQRTVDLYRSHRLHALLAAQQEEYGVARKVLSQTYDLDNSIDDISARQARNLLANLVQL
ncbi:MAG: hypothetical protein BWK78_05920, partial [Thiotrichaceae bacterium IS1]